MEHKFKVVAKKSLGVNLRHHPGFNPFLVRDVFNPNLPKVTYSMREWEFSAPNESEVRRLWLEAKVADLDTVRGYELCTIEVVN